MAWARTRPEAFSEKTGKPDPRGAYGLLAREVIGLLKHLQHAPGKTVIFVGVLEKVTDEFNRDDLAAADGRRQGRPRAARHRRPGDLDAACSPATTTAGATTRRAGRPSAGWSAAPAIPSACPPRTAPAAST